MDRFGEALARLGIDPRREVVKELTELGLSTRAIAPIVGVDQSTVVRDLRSGDADVAKADALGETFGAVTVERLGDVDGGRRGRLGYRLVHIIVGHRDSLALTVNPCQSRDLSVRPHSRALATITVQQRESGGGVSGNYKALAC
jgi:hypothetical protein